MYAFTREQQSAWRQLFERYLESSNAGGAPITLKFDSDQALLCEPGLVFGHTCGYPLMTRLKEQLSPFCVPVFDVPGSAGRYYSSRFIVNADSAIDSIEASRGGIAAINGPDSNSGMNVLRHAVSELDHGAKFFSSVFTSGGHLQSLDAVARGEADIAAIDCVSYRLIEDCRPDLARRVRIIGDSIKTCGLPFVMPKSEIAGTDCAGMVEQLRRALASCPESVHNRLHLVGFESVSLADYESILEVENSAIGQGYPELR
jgi:ABC-type phosphate/phosphonate transport system substrate-binding protein